ncbi:MAG: response regulator [Gemmatimonadaceae bacterium]|nr:response regulator [Gemmatimonadaceae bacterium]
MTSAVGYPPAISTVLIVDDNVDATDSLALLLERVGVQVLVAYDGRSALERFLERRPDAVVMDIGLPVMDGYETARQMRAQQGEAPLLLIALTGWGHPEDRKRSEAAGFDHHLVKPVLPSEIHGLLSQFASRS